jgi:hypothetical protein
MWARVGRPVVLLIALVVAVHAQCAAACSVKTCESAVGGADAMSCHKHQSPPNKGMQPDGCEHGQVAVRAQTHDALNAAAWLAVVLPPSVAAAMVPRSDGDRAPEASPPRQTRRERLSPLRI